MTRVALKGLAARRLRTALTALASVLGVALVSAAFTLTDTMRSAAGSLSSSAYDGTDAVVSAKLPFEKGSESWTTWCGGPSRSDPTGWTRRRMTASPAMSRCVNFACGSSRRASGSTSWSW